MSNYDEYLKIKKQREEKAGKKQEEKKSSYDRYKAVQEARARDLASKTTENLANMNTRTKMMQSQEQFINPLNGKYVDAATRYIFNRNLNSMNTGLRRNEEKVRSDIEESYARREDKENILSQANEYISANKRDRENLMNRNRASNDFDNQFKNKSEYDNAFNMVKYGGKTYDELNAIAAENDKKKAAGLKINEDEDKWIREYAEYAKTSEDIDKERAQVRNEIKNQQKQFVKLFKNTGNMNAKKENKFPSEDEIDNSTKMKKANEKIASLSDRLAELDKEYELRKQKEYYESYLLKDDFEKVSAEGMEVWRIHPD